MNYVLAVSGGVDSMVLLDALVHDRLNELTDSPLTTNHSSLIIAHFDHGIRSDSKEDEALVRGVAEKHGLAYHSTRVELGDTASEDSARKVRYNFLRQCCKKYDAVLVTAHHRDDVIETMLINLIRGTGWRGLAPMNQILDLESQTSDNDPESKIQKSKIKNQILRPLLATSKQDILAYAKRHNVEWREDSTNSDTKYLRNYVRHVLLPRMISKDPVSFNKLVVINQTISSLQNNIAIELQNQIIKYQISNIKYAMPRHELIMFPSLVSLELLRHILAQLDPDWHPQAHHIKRTLHFIKTGLPGKRLEVSGSLVVQLDKRSVQFIKQ